MSKQDESALDSDDFDKDYEYDEVNVVESQKSCKNEEDEEDKFTNDIDLKYDQENSAHAKEIYFFHESNPKLPSLLDSENCDKLVNKEASLGESDESEPEEEEEEEDEYCSSSSDDTCTDNDDYSSNLYDYEVENDEQMYFDKYEYDINSKCCKLYGNNNNEAGLSYATDFAGLNKQAQHSKDVIAKNLSSLSTSIKSIPDESNLIEEAKTEKPVRAGSGEGTSSLNTTMSMSANNVNGQDKAKYKSYNHFVYEKMNKQRLMLVDLLLKNGADKYMITKLSVANVKRLSKKSLGMLRKWYGVARPSTDANISESEHVDENESIELRPLSPMMASLCLDDVEIFSRLYKHHQNLFNYFKPDEDYELIYYAIKFQSKNCLIYLLCNTNGDIELPSLLEQHSSKLNMQLSLPLMTAREDSVAEPNVTLTPASPSINSDSLSAEFQQRLNKNVNTMFYILENTRSSKIVKVLLKCGFDLCKREPLSGNTALHCLFNGNCRTSSSASFAEHKSEVRTSSARAATLDEYHAPHSFSKILFIMLKYGGLKAHVNTLNYEKKLCMQNLFEWNQLVDTVFFKDSFKSVHSSFVMKPATPNRAEWQREFEECVLLLLKSGADLLMLNSGSNNCIETLIASILRNSTSEPAHDQFTIYSNASSASLSQNLATNSSSQAWVIITII